MPATWAPPSTYKRRRGPLPARGGPPKGPHVQLVYDKALLSSGGMDSFLLAHEPALADAIHVFVDVGQTYAGKEWEAAQYAAMTAGAPLYRVQATNMAQFEHASGIIPFRNAELLLCAAQFADNIFLGVIADEVNSDKSEAFCRAMEAVLNISHRRQYWTEGRSFTVQTPFRELSKTDLVRRYLGRGGDLRQLTKTVSCYDGGREHCGKCSSCFKRWVALTVATGQDAIDLQRWNNAPAMWRTRQEWRDKLVGQGYSARRVGDVFKALDIAGV